MSITLDPGLLKWIRSKVGPGLEFSSVSHALERGIVALQEKMKH